MIMVRTSISTSTKVFQVKQEDFVLIEQAAKQVGCKTEIIANPGDPYTYGLKKFICAPGCLIVQISGDLLELHLRSDLLHRGRVRI